MGKFHISLATLSRSNEKQHTYTAGTQASGRYTHTHTPTHTHTHIYIYKGKKRKSVIPLRTSSSTGREACLTENLAGEGMEIKRRRSRKRKKNDLISC